MIKKYILESFSECTCISNVVKVGWMYFCTCIHATCTIIVKWSRPFDRIGNLLFYLCQHQPVHFTHYNVHVRIITTAVQFTVSNFTKASNAEDTAGLVLTKNQPHDCTVDRTAFTTAL